MKPGPISTKSMSYSLKFPLETPRLRLYPLTEADAEFFLEIANTPKWLEYIGDRNIHSVEDAAAYIRKRAATHHPERGNTGYNVTLKSNGKIIGNCGLYQRQDFIYPDLGFAFLPEYEGKGYGTESAQKVLEVAFEVFDLPEVPAFTTEENKGSQALLEKLGFVYQGMIVMSEYPDEETMYYLLKRESWEKAQKKA